MASNLGPETVPQQPSHATPYCNDPDCKPCKELREMQELIRLHELPSREAPTRD